MKSRQFRNIFINNQPPNIDNPSARIYQPMRSSQYFDTMDNYKHQNYPYGNRPIYMEQNVSTSPKNCKNSIIFNHEFNKKQSSLLERSKSQLISSVYVSPFKVEPTDELNQSNHLASSKASQITFAKPSQFINTSPKQSVCFNFTQKNSVLITDPNSKNQYGYSSIHPQINNYYVKDRGINVTSPIKSSYISYADSGIMNSFVVNKNQVNRINNFIEPTMIQSQIFTQRPLKTTVIFKNQPADLNKNFQIRRALSNISIMSHNSRKNDSATKINFNYMSPPKSEQKKTRKLSFKKEQVKSPLKKLTKKKQSSTIKIQKSPKNTINDEVVNEYFPQFKIKRSKMTKNAISPPKRLSKYKKNTVQQVELNKKVNDLQKTQQVRRNLLEQMNFAKKISQNENKIQTISKSQSNLQLLLPIPKVGPKMDNNQDEERRNHTFIAGLQGFSQLSELKIKEKDEVTEITNQTPRKLPLFQYGHNQSFNKKFCPSSQPVKQNDYKANLNDKIISFSGQKNQIFHNEQHEISNILKDSQVSIPSNELNFSKKQENNSSQTTDYEQQMVKKLKQQLGLNYSYYKK